MLEIGLKRDLNQKSRLSIWGFFRDLDSRTTLPVRSLVHAVENLLERRWDRTFPHL